MKYTHTILTLALIVTLFIGLFARLYKLHNPIADWHSFRQADTAAVARNFIHFGIDLLRPRSNDLSNIQSGKDNPSGWRMVEFPIYQALAYGAFQFIPYVPIEIWLRIVTISASLGTAYILYKLVTKTSDPLSGIAACAVYCLLPFSIYYGRIILPDTLAIFLALSSLYVVTELKDSSQKTRRFIVLVISAVLGAASLLVKPVSIFILLPIVYIQIGYVMKQRTSFGSIIFFWIIVLLPIALWRKWIMQFPEGIPAYDWLFNGGGIRFKGAWFYWLFAERISKLILGYWGVVLLVLGILSGKVKKEGYLYLWLLFGSLLYLIVIAGGNVQHDYYQILTLPIISIFVAKGISFLLTNTIFPRLTNYLVLFTITVFMLAFSWYSVRSYYWINNMDIVEAGRQADLILPKTAKVIAPYNGDTAFLYQINRQGWPQGFDIDKKISQGATHYIAVAPIDSNFEARDLATKYEILKKSDRFIIIKLQ